MVVGPAVDVMTRLHTHPSSKPQARGLQSAKSVIPVDSPPYHSDPVVEQSGHTHSSLTLAPLVPDPDLDHPLSSHPHQNSLARTPMADPHFHPDPIPSLDQLALPDLEQTRPNRQVPARSTISVGCAMVS